MKQTDAYALVLDISGGGAGLAAELGKTPEAIRLWKGRVPEKELDAVMRVVRKLARRKMTAIRRLTRKLPTKADLRPDLYPKARGAGRAGKISKGGRRGSKKEESSKTQSREETESA